MTWECEKHGVRYTIQPDGRIRIGPTAARRAGRGLHPLYGLAGCALPMALPEQLKAVTREADLPVRNPDWSPAGSSCHVRRVD